MRALPGVVALLAAAAAWVPGSAVLDRVRRRGPRLDGRRALTVPAALEELPWFVRCAARPFG